MLSTSRRHANNGAEPSKTHTYWYAIVYILLNIIRRVWLLTVERAYVALHSSLLRSARTINIKIMRVWVPFTGAGREGS
jgi:hypothetical protein